jgi:hypothetical protein
MAITIRDAFGKIVWHGIEGKCLCGNTATTEIQVGWFKKENKGQYEEVCDSCRKNFRAQKATNNSTLY